MHHRATGLVAVLAAALACLLSGEAAAGEFMDTRITFTFSDDNVLAGPGETTPSSPRPYFGPNNGLNLFYDNFDTRYDGQESQAHLVMYKKMPGFWRRLTTEAALVLQFDVGELEEGDAEIAKVLSDDGSYIKLTLALDEAATGDANMNLTFFPFDTDRFRLGYTWDVTWGGDDIFPQKEGVSPGFKLGFDWSYGYLFVGLKTAQILQKLAADESGFKPEGDNELQTYYGIPAGIGFDFTDWMRLEFNGGYFQKGTNPQLAVLGEEIHAFGVSGHLVFHQGIPISKSADFKLYKNDPTLEAVLARKDEESPGFSWSLGMEGTVLFQTLENVDDPGSTTMQMAYASVASFKSQIGYFGAHADFVVRNLAFILYNVPSFVPYQEFPESSESSPELFWTVGVDYTIESIHLTPGLSGGIQLPSTFTGLVSQQLTGTSGTLQAQSVRTVVVRQEGDFEVLPIGEDAAPIFGGKLTLRWNLSEIVTVIGEVLFLYDKNRARLRDVNGVATRQFDDPFGLGFGLITQARF